MARASSPACTTCRRRWVRSRACVPWRSPRRLVHTASSPAWRSSRPFTPRAATRAARRPGVEPMRGKLAGQRMSQGAASDRLKMVGDCRVIDLYPADNETRIPDL